MELFFAYESILCVITVNIKENLNAFTASKLHNGYLMYFHIQLSVHYMAFPCICINLALIFYQIGTKTFYPLLHQSSITNISRISML